MPQPTPTPKRARRRRRSPALVVALAVGLLVVALLAAGIWLVVKRPLTVDRFVAVDALEEAGLERHRLDTAAGPLVAWAGGGGDADAPALVLLHGAGDHAGAWIHLLDDLAADHHLVVPDLPGHGDSAPAEGTIPMRTVVDGVETLLASELVTGGAGSSGTGGGRPAPVVVGNSLGGWLALVVAERRPELASRLVVVNGGGTPGPNDPGLLLPSNREEARRILDVVGAPGPLPDAVLDDLVRTIRSGPLSRFSAADDHEDYDLTGKLGSIRVPVDLIWGSLDGYLPMTYAQATADALPASHLTVIEGCGHVPPRYCPELFRTTLREVLASPPPSLGPGADEADLPGLPGGEDTEPADDDGTSGEAAP